MPVTAFARPASTSIAADAVAEACATLNTSVVVAGCRGVDFAFSQHDADVVSGLRCGHGKGGLGSQSDQSDDRAGLHIE